MAAILSVIAVLGYLANIGDFILAVVTRIAAKRFKQVRYLR